MKIRYCVSLLLLCAATIFSKSTTANADDKYVKLCERYFTIAENYGQNLVRKTDLLIFIRIRRNTATIVGIPMDKKKVVVPAKINGKKVIKIDIMPTFIGQRMRNIEMNFTENMRTFRSQRWST